MNLDKLKLHFLLFLIVIYYSQGVLYPQGSLTSQIVLVIILVMSFYYLLLTTLLFKNNVLFFEIWTLLFVLNLLGFLFTGELQNQYHFSMFKGIVFNSLIFYPFYYFSRLNILNKEVLSWYIFVLLPIFIVQFNLNEESVLSSRLSNKTDVVNNVSYFFVGLIPFVFFIKNRLISFAFIFIIVYFIIFSAKRGAVLSGAVGFIYFLFSNFVDIRNKNKILIYFFSLVLVICISYYVYFLFANNDFLISRFESQESSGRDVIYKSILDRWYNSKSFLNIFFGFGFASSLRLSGTGNFAHNDWLELLCNFGLFGVLVYIVFFISFLRLLLRSMLESRMLIVGLSVLSICFVNTLVYRFYSGADGFLLAIIFSFLCGHIVRVNYGEVKEN